MVLKLHVFPGSIPCMKVMLGLQLAGVEFEVVNHLTFESVKTEEFLKLNPAGKVPVLETEEGPLVESNAILRYTAYKYNSKLYSEDLKEKLEIDQAFYFIGSLLESSYASFVYPLFGFPFPHLSYKLEDFRNNSKAYLEKLKAVDAKLKGKDHVVLGRYTIADVLLWSCLYKVFNIVYDENTRKSLPNLSNFYEKITNTAEYKSLFGRARLCKKGFMLPKLKIAKEQPKKKEAPKPKEQPKKEQKEEEFVEPKKPTYTPPKSDLNLFNLKTDFCNTTDKVGFLKDLYAKFDTNAYSFWHLKYIKYGSEGKVDYLTCNLMDGFLDRAELTKKHVLGVHCVYGEESCYDIEGVWLCNSPDSVPLIEHHVQNDVYEYIKLDHNNEEHRKLIESFFTLAKEEEDKIYGKLVTAIRTVK